MRGQQDAGMMSQQPHSCNEQAQMVLVIIWAPGKFLLFISCFFFFQLTFQKIVFYCTNNTEGTKATMSMTMMHHENKDGS